MIYRPVSEISPKTGPAKLKPIIGTPHDRNLLRFWWPRYSPIYWVMRKCVNVAVTHVSWATLDVEFDGNIHFYVWLEAKVRPNKVKSPNTISLFWSMPVFSFALGFQKWHLFWRNIIKKLKKRISKYREICSGLTPKSLRSSQFFSQDVLTVRNRLISNHWHSLSSLSVINFGHISERIKSVCNGPA